MNGQQTDFSAAFRQCLETLDIDLMRKLWRHVAPNMPQPESDDDTLVSIHIARTESKTVKTKLRMYSHCWLRERGYPSRLPDHMKVSAERLYPKIVRTVGISVNSSSPLFKPVMKQVQKAMQDAVMDIHADDPELTDDDLITRHMREARKRTLNKLLGIKGT
jgi:hypothetical protein